MKVPRMNIGKTKGGFTLIEILLAIGILAILATAAIIAINPARQFAQARNTQRWNDIHAIMNAVYQYSVGHKGLLPLVIPTSDNGLTEICMTGVVDCSGLVDLVSLTTNSEYITVMPIDPSCPDSCSQNGTGYAIVLTVDGRVQVLSLHNELGQEISLVR